MLVAHPAERTWSLWRNQALRTIRHNRRLFQKLHTNVRTVSVQSPGGIHLGEAASFPVPGTVYNSVIEKTIRGLYYHHSGETLGDRAVVAASMYRGLTEEMKTNTEMLSQNDIGKGVFIYRYGRTEDSPLESVWIFQFYECHWAYGQTVPNDT
jgi:hypothetical protein